MKFRTEFNARQSCCLLNPEAPVVLIGSCFTDNIGQRMRSCRWRAFPNICGTLYNPASIANILRLTTEKADFLETIESSIVQRERLYVSWLFDSQCTSYSKSETKERAIDNLLTLRKRLEQAHTLIVTFGTAWVYELSGSPGYIVGNCHKFPSDTFIRRRLTVSQIVDEWDGLLSRLSDVFSNLRYIFTVSPVRHLKDGFEGNSSSKAILRLACEEICRDNENRDYFPAFEIMNDDLRDYRFYASDMVHPSETAVDYIWQKFQERYLSEASRSLLLEGEKVTKRLNHRPILHGNSEMAKYVASVQEYEASEQYNSFISAHPGMLGLGE